jgi:hypothetical protein
MLRRLGSIFGVAMSIFGATIFVPGTAASADVVTRDTAAQGTWVYIKWYQGNDRFVKLRCELDGRHAYPGQRVECRGAGDTTQLWVEF